MRIKPEAFHAVPGVPRSSEYESVLEQDPFGDTHETGGNDDIWGEWGLDKDAPFLSTLQALGLWSVGMTSLYVFYKTAWKSFVTLFDVFNKCQWPMPPM